MNQLWPLDVPVWEEKNVVTMEPTHIHVELSLRDVANSLSRRGQFSTGADKPAKTCKIN